MFEETTSIDILDLDKFLEHREFCVLGCPQGVGITTFMAHFLTEKFIFEDDVLILFVTNNPIDKLLVTNILTHALKEDYGLDYKQNKDCFVLNNNKMYIINFSEWDVVESDKIWNYVYFDGDFLSLEQIKSFENKIKKLFISTYDTENSIYYNTVNKYRVKLVSDYSRKNVQKILKNPSSSINEDALIFGYFTSTNN